MHHNIILDILNPSDALFVEEGAAKQNNLYSNKLIDINGQEISLDKQEEVSNNVDTDNW